MLGLSSYATVEITNPTKILTGSITSASYTDDSTNNFIGKQNTEEYVNHVSTGLIKLINSSILTDSSLYTIKDNVYYIKDTNSL
jgi:hypothetical protein